MLAKRERDEATRKSEGLEKELSQLRSKMRKKQEELSRV